MSADDHPPAAPRAFAAAAGERITEVFLSIRSKLERVIASKVGDQTVAADLTQDLYLRLERVDARLANDDEAQRYLIRMAVNASIDHLRVEGRRLELLEGVVDLFDDVDPHSPEEAALTDDQIRVVDRALDELPEKCRQMLFLSRVEGLTHAEIAAQMGVSKVLVEKYVARALLHCRARLMAEG